MDFSVEFYETAVGNCPVREFLDDLNRTDPDDFAAVVAGLAKLKQRINHREPLSKSIGDGLFEPASRRKTEYSRALVLYEGTTHHRRSRCSE